MTRRHRPAALLAGCLLLLPLLLTTGCAFGARTPVLRLGPDDTIKAATRQLTDACLARHGLALPRRGAGKPSAARQQRVSDALFGTGKAQLSVRLKTGYTVSEHTDGCLAAANRRLYGDQRRWFRASTVVNNLEPEAATTHRSLARVRASHRTELADYRRLRAHALTQARTLLQRRLTQHAQEEARP